MRLSKSDLLKICDPFCVQFLNLHLFYLCCAFFWVYLVGGVASGAEPVCLPLKGWVFSGQLLRNCVESLSFRSCLRCPRVLVSAVMHFVCSAAATHPQWQMKVDALPYWDKWGGTGESTAGTSALMTLHVACGMLHGTRVVYAIT